MRKALKFKACIFLIAWSTIFIHNIIPHNHENDGFPGCIKLVHNLGSCTSDEDKTFEFDKEHSDLKICHLSNFLFHNLSPEAFLAYIFRDLNFNPENQKTDFFSQHDHFYFSGHLDGAKSLRAPPVIS